LGETEKVEKERILPKSTSGLMVNVSLLSIYIMGVIVLLLVITSSGSIITT
jgi:hypothetical protein